jgi:hypothetical protein
MIEVEKIVHRTVTRYIIKGTDLPHRADGPAFIWVSGKKEWYFYGKCHRLDGPAIEWDNGDKEWCIHGELHREDGPAIIRRDGKMQWYLNDQHYTKEEWFEALTEEKKVKALYSEYFMGE